MRLKKEQRRYLTDLYRIGIFECVKKNDNNSV